MKKYLILVCILLITVICAVYFLFLKKTTTEKNQPQLAETIKNSGVDVKTVIARKDEVSTFITTTAEVNAIVKGEIKSMVSSFVKSIPLKEGEFVNKGDILIKLDTRHIENELAKYRAQYIKTVSEFMFELNSSTNDSISKIWQKYQLKIADQNKIPPYPPPKSAKTTIMLSRMNVQSTYNQVKETELKLENCEIRAPFKGIVSNLKIYPGAQVSVGNTICNLTDLSRMKLVIDILEEDITSIKSGSKVIINDYKIQPLNIATILPEIQKEKHTGQALAYFNNPEFMLKDGQTVQIRIRKNLYENRLIVPREALLNRNDRDLIFVVKKGLAKWRYVDIGVGNSNYIEILKGIILGDSVIVEGHYSLGHDVKVNPI